MHNLLLSEKWVKTGIKKDKTNFLELSENKNPKGRGEWAWQVAHRQSEDDSRVRSTKSKVPENNPNVSRGDDWASKALAAETRGHELNRGLCVRCLARWPV